MTYNIFLDDNRFPSEYDPRSYRIIRNYKDFCQLIETLGVPNFISFDHDIGDFDENGNERNGKTCAQYLTDYMMNKKIYQKINYQVHSQNPEGEKNIKGWIDDWNRKIENNFFENH